MQVEDCDEERAGARDRGLDPPARAAARAAADRRLHVRRLAARCVAARAPYTARMATVGTKADDLALALEEAIVSGEIAPGTVLRQEQLSEQYSVSRTPVREALRRLAALGLVSFVPNRGVRVRTLSREELREAFLVRAELESLATELATPRIDRRGLAGARRGRADASPSSRSSCAGARARARRTARWSRAGCTRTMRSTT